jgi:phage tail-like protein
MIDLVEFHSGVRFLVQVEGMYNIIFTEFKLPSLSVDLDPLKEGGQNMYTHQLPVRVNVGTATLRHGISRDMQLLNWYMQVMSGDFANAYRQVTVMLVDTAKFPVALWNFRDVLPTKWVGPTLKSSSGEVAIEELEFVYHGFEFEGAVAETQNNSR